MLFYRVVGLISILPILVSAADSDLLWSSNDDVLSSNSQFSGNQFALPNDPIGAASPFGLAELPMDLAYSPTDSSVVPLENTDLFSSASGSVSGSLPDDYTIVDQASDNPFEITDCSTADFFPAMGKSRVRRLDENGACKNPTKPLTGATPKSPGGDQTPDISRLNELLKNPGIYDMPAGAGQSNDHNMFCHLYTNGRLPYGTCSSGNPADELKSGEQLRIRDWPLVDVYTLTHCTNGMLSMI
jgi:hypothetical protein